MSNSRKLTIARNKAGKIEILRAGKTLILRHFECSNECIILERKKISSTLSLIIKDNSCK